MQRESSHSGRFQRWGSETLSRGANVGCRTERSMQREVTEKVYQIGRRAVERETRGEG
ncbi:MAG: hypothetical protein ABFD98_03570 [Syntrophobacteraceae bacterium]